MLYGVEITLKKEVRNGVLGVGTGTE